MLTRQFRKIDSFYPVFIVVVVALAFLTIYTFRGIFSSVIAAFETEVNVDDAKIHIDRARLDAAIKAVYDKDTVLLEVR